MSRRTLVPTAALVAEMRREMDEAAERHSYRLRAEIEDQVVLAIVTTNLEAAVTTEFAEVRWGALQRACAATLALKQVRQERRAQLAAQRSDESTAVDRDDSGPAGAR